MENKEILGWIGFAVISFVVFTALFLFAFRHGFKDGVSICNNSNFVESTTNLTYIIEQSQNQSNDIMNWSLLSPNLMLMNMTRTNVINCSYDNMSVEVHKGIVVKTIYPCED